MRITLHWLGRVLFLVFAGFATLSIIGSIAAIPSGGMGGRTLFPGPAAAPGPAPVDEQQAAPAEPRPVAPGGPADNSVLIAPEETVLAPAPLPPPDPVVRWLEPITYALIAIAALLAAIVLLLWRIGSAIRDAGIR